MTRPEPVALAFVLNLRLTQAIIYIRFGFSRMILSCSYHICTDSSHGVSVRFGETIRSYVQEYGTASSLEAIPLALAGWLRYFYAIDDEGKPFALAPDPLAQELHDAVSRVKLGEPDTLTDQLHGVLSNKEIFGSDLYEAGVAQKIEAFFKEEIAGPGAVRATLKKYLH